MAYSKAQGRATTKYTKKNYKVATVSLRKVDDADIIANLRVALDNGYNKTEWLRGLFEGKRIV